MNAVNNAILAQIKLVIFDVDGVLTDGSLYYGPEGEIVKSFNVKDGVGINLLHACGIEIAIITARSSLAISKRIEDLKINHAYLNCRDKMSALLKLKKTLNIDNHEIAYIADDIFDLPIMEIVGLSITPMDGYSLVKESVDLIARSKGGEGVAREVADLIVSAKTDLNEAYYKLIAQHTISSPCSS